MKKFYTKENMLTLSLIFAVITIASWLQVGPVTYNQYFKVCSSNFSVVTKDYAGCMNPFTSAFKFYQTLLYLGGLLTFITVILFIFGLLTKKFKKD